jgi:hypothetical protein
MRALQAEAASKALSNEIFYLLGTTRHWQDIYTQQSPLRGPEKDPNLFQSKSSGRPSPPYLNDMQRQRHHRRQTGFGDCYVIADRLKRRTRWFASH